MYITDLLFQSTMLHRGLVTYANTTTGEIKVKIPSILGTSEEMAISYIGRTSNNDKVWSVPTVGSQIVVASDDTKFTNLFWVQVNPDPSISILTVKVAELTAQVAALMA
jgi:phage baseplate assembly protein gpV